MGSQRVGYNLATFTFKDFNAAEVSCAILAVSQVLQRGRDVLKQSFILASKEMPLLA